MWDPPIICRGRSYPSAPVTHLLGSTRRPPSHWWGFFSPAWNDLMPPENTLIGMKARPHDGLVSLNPSAHWDYQPGPVPGFPASTHVYHTWIDPFGTTGYSLWCEAYMQSVGTKSFFGRWRLIITGSVDNWGNAWNLPLFSWSHGSAVTATPPDPLGIYNLHYSQLPVGRCLTVESPP